MVYSKRSHLIINRRRQDTRDECQGGSDDGECDGSESYRSRGIEREARRRRRREKREKQDVLEHNEGMSSDEEILETDRLEFIAELGETNIFITLFLLILSDSLQKDIQTVFTDVVSDFSDLNIIKTRFEQWKFTQPTSYEHAYVSICLTKVLAPYVRYEMLHWNPLQVCLVLCD